MINDIADVAGTFKYIGVLFLVIVSQQLTCYTYCIDAVGHVAVTLSN